MSNIEDEWALRKLVYAYARAVDRCELNSFDEIFTPEATYNGNNARLRLREIATRLKERCLETMHTVSNQTVTIRDAQAEGETYAIAHHVVKGPAGSTVIYDIGMRYTDQYICVQGKWQIASRRTTRVWAETRPVRFGEEIGPMSG